MATAKQAILRVCARCEWIFRENISLRVVPDTVGGCPKCGFASYGARSVYGKQAYSYEKTQEPWVRKKMDSYYGELQREIKESRNGRVDDRGVKA